MPILEDDIQLLKSQVLDDVPEGGGAATGQTITDGASNNLFADISELDRVYGDVSLRKVFVGVRTNTTDTYLGAHVIVAADPADPDVSAVIFDTGDYFDTRAQAQSRVEQYLGLGPAYPGCLFSNHVAGQMTILVWQRGEELPTIGSTLVLRKHEGTASEFTQYVKITEAAAVVRTFSDGGSDFERRVLTLKLSDPLRADFPGFDVSRNEITQDQLATKTKIFETVVADAARYYGIATLTEAANVGDFGVRADSVFAQLVPSAQIEMPIADARTNQVSANVVASGAPVSRTITATLDATHALFIGGAISPGTLTLTAAGLSASDNGGKLLGASDDIGAVDCENGVITLATNYWGTGSHTFDITYAPAVAVPAVNRSAAVLIRIENRSLSYVQTIEPAPSRGSLIVSYMAGGRWYVLRENGSGAIRGSSTAFGAGNLNFATGTVAVTLGALPDVGSAVILQWTEASAVRAAAEITLDNNGTLYWPINSDGQVSLDKGSKTIAPGLLTVTWNNGGVKTLTDDGAGRLVGAGGGDVNYATGVVRLSPNPLPPVGTPITLTMHTAAPIPEAAVALTSIGSAMSGNLGATHVKPGSVQLRVNGVRKYKQLGASSFSAYDSTGKPYRLIDDGAGKLLLLIEDQRMEYGTVDYETGEFTIQKQKPLGELARVIVGYDNFYRYVSQSYVSGSARSS